MTKNKTKKLLIKRKREIIFGCFVIFLIAMLFLVKIHYAGVSIKNSITPTPAITNQPISPTVITAPTTRPTQIILTLTPTETKYKYILWKTNDEIHLKPNTGTGYSIAAYLLDENWEVVTNQDGFKYEWSMDDESLVKDDPSAFSGCTRGIQPPCPEDHYSFAAAKAGSTLIRVKVTKDGQVVASTTFPLIIED